MKKPLLTLIIILFFTTLCTAEDFPFGQLNRPQLDMVKYKDNESAHALVLNEYGESRLFIETGGRITLRHVYHVRIKIFDNDGLKYGTVVLPLYNSGNDNAIAEEVDEVKCITTYKDESGAVKTEEFNPKQIFAVKQDKNHSMIKFALPALRNGCIIEYTYRFVTPYFENFREWHFQTDLPKLHSQYEAYIPALWTFNALLKGAQKLTKNTSEREPQCFTSAQVKADCLHSTYAMDNIPAFVGEEYMTASKNFMSAIYFELSEYTNPYTGDHVKVAKEWKDVDKLMKKNSFFGDQLRKKDILKDKIQPITVTLTDPLDKAKAVYDYIKKNIQWNNYYAIGSDGIRDALDKHSGNIADINLALVSALNTAGLNAEAVLLSTRDHGVINKLYPVITEFNYIIAKVDIAGQPYLLDATDPLLPFGILPLRCLNDKGRVMPIDKDSYWVDLMTNQHQNSLYMLNLTLQENGKLKGKFYNNSYGYAAYEKRRAIKKFNTIAEYVENLDERLTKVSILKSEVKNIDSLDLPLNETYDIEIDAYDNLNHQRLAFNPYLFNRVINNPFKLDDRTYPVDLGMPADTKFILNMTLPNGFSIESAPQIESFTLPDQAGKFIVTYQPGDNAFTFTSTLSLKKPVYSSEEYSSLKELYNKIILSEKLEMVFKRKI